MAEGCGASIFGEAREVLKTLFDNGGRFLDTVHGNSPTEEVTARIATELAVQDKVFWSSRASPAGPLQQGQLKSQASRVR